MMRWGVGLAILAGAVGLAGTAEAASRQSASLRFTSRVPGTVTGTRWRLSYRDPANPGGKPPSLARTIATFPRGSRIDTTAPASCDASDAELMADGPSACPRASRVGVGKIDLDTGSPYEAAFPRILHNDVVNLNRPGESILYAEATNGPTRTVTRAKVRGRTVTTEVPPVAAFPPPDPYVAIKRVRLDVAPMRRRGRAYVRTPASCPRSRRWTFVLVFEYRDGVRQTVRSRTPCVPRA